MLAPRSQGLRQLRRRGTARGHADDLHFRARRLIVPKIAAHENVVMLGIVSPIGSGSDGFVTIVIDGHLALLEEVPVCEREDRTNYRCFRPLA